MIDAGENDWESGIGNRETGKGNRDSGIGNRDEGRSPERERRGGEGNRHQASGIGEEGSRESGEGNRDSGIGNRDEGRSPERERRGSAPASHDPSAPPSGCLQPLPPPDHFLEQATALNIIFEPGEVGRLGLFLALLLDANRSFNLTAIRDSDEAWTRHILDSLTLLPLLADLEDGARIIDVGSGGGLPGIPLAIVLPRLRLTLLEATGKKAAFLQRTAGQLGLANVEFVNDRAERAGQDRGGTSAAGSRRGEGGGGHREAYDAVTARALGKLATGAELTVPLARVGGRVLLVKGQRAEEELAEAASALHLLKVVHVGTHDTPTGRIVVLEKHARTPRMYPRRDGEPKRSPL